MEAILEPQGSDALQTAVEFFVDPGRRAIIIAVISGLVVATVLFFPARDFHYALRLAGYVSSVEKYSGENNNEDAKRFFLQVLKAAEHHFEVFDDGDKDTESVYEDEEIVQSVVERLESVATLHIVCYFNMQDNLHFIETLRGHDRVTIHDGINTENRPLVQTHYKIADLGKVAYLTEHRLGDEDRKFRYLDCRSLKGKSFESTAKFLFDPVRAQTRHVHS